MITEAIGFVFCSFVSVVFGGWLFTRYPLDQPKKKKKRELWVPIGKYDYLLVGYTSKTKADSIALIGDEVVHFVEAD